MFYNKATLWQASGGGGGGSISYVSNASNTGQGVSSVVVSLTGTQAGDTVFVLVQAARDSSSSGPPVACTISGYTLHTQNTQQSNYCGLFWKRLTGADTSFTVSTNTVNNQTVAVALVFRGVNATPFGNSPTFAAGGFPSSQIDPPSVTPTVAGSVVLAMGGITVDNLIVTLTGLSSGYNNQTYVNLNSGGAPAARAGICWKSWTSGAMDPGMFSLTYTNNGMGTLSLTAVIVP